MRYAVFMTQIERSSRVYAGREFYKNRPVTSQAPFLGRDIAEAHEYEEEIVASANEHNLRVLPREPIVPIIGTTALRKTTYRGMSMKDIRRDPDIQTYLAKANAIDDGSTLTFVHEPVVPIHRPPARGRHRGSIGLRIYDAPQAEHPTEYVFEAQRMLLRSNLGLETEATVPDGLQGFPAYIVPIVALPHDFLRQDGALDWIKETVPQIETPNAVTAGELRVYEKEVSA